MECIKKLQNALQAMYPRDDYLDENSRFVLKVNAAFQTMKKKGYTDKQINEITEEFFETWKSQYWMPADLIDIHRRIHGDDRMIM